MTYKPMKGNCARAHDRRTREGFYTKYINGLGLDIGCAQRIRSISQDAQLWDMQTTPGGDATFMKGVPDDTYDYVMASHILEHLDDVETALKNWLRITKPGGHLIVCIPERDLFECKKELPSKWNKFHKWYFKLDEAEPPVTLNFTDVITSTLGDSADVEYIQVCDELWDPVTRHAPGKTVRDDVGEFQIEAVVRKKDKQ